MNNQKNTLPKDWKMVKLGEVCTNPQYGYTTSASVDGDLKFVRTTDITSGNINWETVPFCKENPKDYKKYLLEDGDILISRAGSVGYSFLLEKPLKSVFASYLIRFKPIKEIVYIKYFYLFLKSPKYWNEISEKSLGIAVPNVNASKLKEIQIPLPPLATQEKIVAKIESLFADIDTGLEKLKKAQQQLKIYRQAVLKAAFSGKLTPNNNDEWKLVKLGEVLSVSSGKMIKVKNLSEGEYPVYGGNGINGYYTEFFNRQTDVNNRKSWG